MKIRLLIDKLKEASRAYYSEGREIMSDREYDELYDKLVELENKTGIIYSDSPTQNVGYQVVSKLEKEEHKFPMLSLGKTKSVDDLIQFANQDCLLSWKMDGLTVVLEYANGSLAKALTRGNGKIGEVITNNAVVFQNVPKTIPYKGDLLIRGEAVIHFEDFERINSNLPQDKVYKNPRNLCSGTVRLLNNEIVKERNVQFYAFALVDSAMEHTKKSEQLEFLEQCGFSVVGYVHVDAQTVKNAVSNFQEAVKNLPYATDGLVLTIDDLEISKKLGATGKTPEDSIAFKWKDEIVATKLTRIDWTPSRTGRINPVAVFDPIELEGTIVQRASVHNLTILEKLELGIGDEIGIYKANMIIPQIAENYTKSNTVEVPANCPVCSSSLAIEGDNEARFLVCKNKKCKAKQEGKILHFVGRDMANIDGLSYSTIQKFLEVGILSSVEDVFKIKERKQEITKLSGYGEKSYQKLENAIEKAREISLPNFIYALAIESVGYSNAALLATNFHSIDKIRKIKNTSEITAIKGFGEEIAKSIVTFFADEENQKTIDNLLKEMTIKDYSEPVIANSPITNKVFVITGSLESFNNRKELEKLIAEMGAKTSGTVSANTDYLINNDKNSTSSKNKKARELGIPDISEKEFLELLKK